jgi:hypothetical protein
LFRHKTQPRIASEAQSQKIPAYGKAQEFSTNPAVWTRALNKLPLQAKLTVNQPGDAYEQEADQVAERVMRMPEPQVQRTCACGGVAGPEGECEACKAKRLGVQRKSEAGSGTHAPASVHETIRSSGQPLDTATRAFMEPRFGQDFSGVRVHTDSKAAESAQDVSAQAYTLGNNIVFGAGQFAPGTHAGRQLIAHELAHTVQQEQGIRRNVIQRRSGCSTTQDTTITDDHTRARDMLSNAISAVSSYNGTTPTKVFNALSTHFHGATSNAFATWINVNLRFLWAVTWLAGYECYTGGLLERTWACGSGALATTFWCVPTVNIRLCPPYFTQSDTERSTTMIHEWVHKYGCNFDLGYEGEADYPKNTTVTQLLNADSFSSFVRDVQ